MQRIRNYKLRFKEYLQERSINKFINTNKLNQQFNDFRKHTLIFGVPRGGTSWLQEILVQERDAIIWEPLHFEHLQKHTNANFHIHMGHIPYIPKEAIWADAEHYFSLLFKGEIAFGLQNHFQLSNLPLSSTTGLTIKFCRGNLLLPWLTKSFPSIRPIYLIRHPLTTIASQWNYTALKDIGVRHNIFNVQNPKHHDIFDQFEKFISKAKSREAVFANWWAIQNIIPLTANQSNWITVSYEHLFATPEIELKRIGNYLERDLTDNLIRVDKPSFVTMPESCLIHNREMQLESWKRVLTIHQAREIMAIIKDYGIDIYDETPFPNIRYK